MTHAELINVIVHNTSLPKKDIEIVISQLMTVIREQMTSGQDMRINGLGTLKVTDRAARTGRNPSTGETIQIAAKKAISFKPAKELKNALNA